VRARAIAILGDVDRGRFASDLFASDEKRFVRALVLGVLRRRLTLDTIHAAFGRKPVEELDPRVRAGVRVGLYQLLFMDGVPPHAAVGETVGAVREPGRGYVNAVLRAVLRDSHTVPPERDRGGAHPSKRLERAGRSVTFFSRPVFPDPEQDRVAWLAAVHSHPAFLVERWLRRDDEDEVVARMEANNEPTPVTLRPRFGRVDAAGLVERLRGEDVVAGVWERPGGLPAVRVAKGQEGVLSGRAFRAGLFSVQAPEQMDAAEILAPQPGEVVWDACAAPGGKTCQLAELGPEALVVGTDVSAERLEKLTENAARLGLDNVRCAAFDALGDESPPHRPGAGFDAVLLDAPCSNSAVLGARPEARWRLRPDTFAAMADLQRRLLAAARRHLKPGGRLVFSSCSLEPEEGVEHGLAATGSPLVWLELV
jgi:16S rRNA (cytosine967-C5)-methyltransferase